MGEAKGASVLLVEDESLISELVSDVLSEHGFEVHAVGDAESALDYLHDHSDIDVLFTDINLPGMDGSQLASRAREMRPELPIVYTSGRHSPSSVKPFVSRSMFLRKPYDPVEVCTLLERLAS